MAKAKHTHKVKRGKYKNGTTYYKCQVPGCTFLILTSFMVGRPNICWKCENPFILDKATSRWAKPTCKDCRGKSSVPEETEAIGTAEANPLEELMKEYE